MPCGLPGGVVTSSHSSLPVSDSLWDRGVLDCDSSSLLATMPGRAPVLTCASSGVPLAAETLASALLWCAGVPAPGCSSSVPRTPPVSLCVSSGAAVGLLPPLCTGHRLPSAVVSQSVVVLGSDTANVLASGALLLEPFPCHSHLQLSWKKRCELVESALRHAQHPQLPQSCVAMLPGCLAPAQMGSPQVH